jgi:2-polyprenyl-6-methoxyphenol hydroxylase-like FAD-dependent oxidoreductase
MGFKDVKVLAESLATCEDWSADLQPYLLRYERTVRFEHDLMRKSLTAVNHVFSRSGFAQARARLLQAGDRMPWLKRLMIEKAMWLD